MHIVTLTTELLPELNLVAFSDCRAQDPNWLLDLLRSWNDKPDLILYGGDDISRFRPRGKNYFELLAAESRFGLCAITGNDEDPRVRRHITGKNVHELQHEPVRLGDLVVMGLEGAPILPHPQDNIGRLLHAEDWIANVLESRLKRLSPRDKLIILSHTPPYRVLDCAIRYGHRPIGSRKLASFVRRNRQVRFVICGHVHSQGGKDKRLGSAWAVNVASHDGPGDPLRVCLLTWFREFTIPRIGWIHLREYDELRGVWGIETEYAKRLSEAGINSRAQLSTADPGVVGHAIGWSAQKARVFCDRAKAIVKDEAIALGHFSAPPEPRAYFDIETDLRQDYVWLIGVFDEKSGFRRFLAQTPNDEKRILETFARHVTKLNGRTFVAYSGADFDRRVLIQRMKAHRVSVPFAIEESVDILYPLMKSVALPTPSARLKDVGRALGYEFKHSELDGIQVALEYAKMVRTKRRIPRRLLEYNRDDVMAVRHVMREVGALTSEMASVQPS